MDLVWAQVITDPFLRRLILRYFLSGFIMNHSMYSFIMIGYLECHSCSWLPPRLFQALLKLKLLNGFLIF